MSEPNLTFDEGMLPSDLVEAVSAEAERDADQVAAYLDSQFADSGIQHSEKNPIPLPPEFLLGLGAAFRLRRWEQAQIRHAVDAELPSSEEAIDEVFRSALAGDTKSWANGLSSRLLRLFFERFAWSAQAELSAEVLLDPADETAAIELLADFLWKHRRLTDNERMK